jgi:hypothetical protein
MRPRVLIIAIAILAAQTAYAWNATGHEAVAAIAWDNMTPKAQDRAIALLMKAPADACLLDLFPTDNRPLKVRQREYFIRAATWPDIVRPNKDRVTGAPDPRPCVKFHQPDFHFFDHFWSGTSGATGSDAPKDRPDVPLATTNAVERMQAFRPLVACKTGCSDSPDKQAMDLAWILHLVGDTHQPLHNAGRVTTEADEKQGDRGGNLFLLDQEKDKGPKNLHSFWDGIIDSTIPRAAGETEQAYVTRVAGEIERDHPKCSITDLKPGQFKAWSEEGLAIAKKIGYPESLHRNQQAGAPYQVTVFLAADKAIATGGYRLADLLNHMFE